MEITEGMKALAARYAESHRNAAFLHARVEELRVELKNTKSALRDARETREAALADLLCEITGAR